MVGMCTSTLRRVPGSDDDDAVFSTRRHTPFLITQTDMSSMYVFLKLEKEGRRRVWVMEREVGRNGVYIERNQKKEIGIFEYNRLPCIYN